MGKCGSRSRVSQVIRRHIYSLNRGNRPLLCRGDTLLQGAHLRSQSRLISYRGRHTSQQSGYLGACLGKTENIINKQKHILILHITEIFCHGQAGKGNSHTGSRRLVHLTIYQSGLVDNAALLHLAVKIISLTGTLANACKYRQAAVSRSNVVDQLHNKNRLSYAGTAEQTDLTALCVRTDQVYYLDTCLQDFCSRHLLFIGRSRTMDSPALHILRSRLLIYRIT